LVFLGRENVGGRVLSESSTFYEAERKERHVVISLSNGEIADKMKDYA
jgi:hypothetical protein